MIKLNHAILHAFDFETSSVYLSQQELDILDQKTRSYVVRLVRKALGSIDNQSGKVAPDTPLAKRLNELSQGMRSFIDFSVELTQALWEALRKSEDLEPADVLVTFFTDTAAAKVNALTEGGEMSSQLAEAKVQALDDDDFDEINQTYLGFFILPRKLTFAHELLGQTNQIVRQDATLPNPTQKIDSYALINLDTRDFFVSDKPRKVGSIEQQILLDEILRSSAEASAKNVVHEVESIASRVAQEFGQNVCEVVAKTKATVASRVQKEEEFNPHELAGELFESNDTMRERFEEEVTQKSLPQKVVMKPSAATRLATQHKIKTDTGIEITFPTRYASNSNYLEFTRDEDGQVTILIKGVTHIENK